MQITRYLIDFVCTLKVDFIISYHIISYCIVLYCIVLYCIVLYCIVLYCITELGLVGLGCAVYNIFVRYCIYPPHWYKFPSTCSSSYRSISSDTFSFVRALILLINGASFSALLLWFIESDKDWGFERCRSIISKSKSLEVVSRSHPSNC